MHLISPRTNKWLLFIALLSIGFAGFAQAPNLLNYQGVARNIVGNPLPNQTMNLRLSIHNNSASGSVVYSETRAIQTNLGGLFAVQIGSAGSTSSVGTMAGINWSTGNKFLQVEIDASNTNQFVDIGTTQLISVPYALNAATANSAVPSGVAGGDLSGNFPNPVVANATVTYPKIQDVTASDRVLGRVSARAGVIEEIPTSGTGNVVRTTSPTLVTPTLGDASATTINGLTPTALPTGFSLSGGTISIKLIVSKDATISGTNTGDQIEFADEEASASAGQTVFTLTNTPSILSKLKMFINGVRISNSAYSISEKVLTYDPAANGNYTFTAGDRVQFDYSY